MIPLVMDREHRILRIIASIVMIVVSKFTETPPQETIDRHFTV